MGVENPTKETGAPPVHRVWKRNASEADLATARMRIGESFTDVPTEKTNFAKARLQIIDAYLDDLRRLVVVAQITGTW